MHFLITVSSILTTCYLLFHWGISTKGVLISIFLMITISMPLYFRSNKSFSKNRKNRSKNDEDSNEDNLSSIISQQNSYLNIIDEDGSSLISIIPTKKYSKKLAIQGDGGTLLKGAIQAFSNLSNTAHLPKSTYLVSFSPKTQNLIEKSSLIGVTKNGMIQARNQSGKIVENAKKVNTPISKTKINPAQLTALAWSIGSMAFAQKHLADINKTLEEIKEELQKIQQWQEDRDLSELV